MRTERDDGESLLRFGRATAMVVRSIEKRALATVDLSLSQYGILFSIAEGGIGQLALSEWLAVSQPAVSQAIEGLVARQLVIRTTDDNDRRRRVLEITHAGSKVLRAADEATVRELSEWLADAPPSAQLAAVRAARTWASIAEKRIDAIWKEGVSAAGNERADA